MQSSGCNFVVASGNQYYQLRDLLKEQILKFAPGIPCYDNELIARKKSVQDRRRLPLQPHPSEAEK